MFAAQYGSWWGKQWHHHKHHQETASTPVRLWRQHPLSSRSISTCVNKQIWICVLFSLCIFVSVFLCNITGVNDGQKRRRLEPTGRENRSPTPSSSGRAQELMIKLDTPIIPSVRSRVQQLTQRREGKLELKVLSQNYCATWQAVPLSNRIIHMHDDACVVPMCARVCASHTLVCNTVVL